MYLLIGNLKIKIMNLFITDESGEVLYSRKGDNNFSDKEEKSIKKYFDKDIVSYTIIFNDGVAFKRVQDISEINPSTTKEILVKIKNK